MERVKKAFDAYLAKRKEIEERNKQRVNRFLSLNETVRDFFGMSNAPIKVGDYKEYSFAFCKNGVIVYKDNVAVVSSMVDDELWDYLLASFLSIINFETENLWSRIFK